MKVAMVSEHASPLAAIGGVDAGGQNVHVAALAGGIARRGADVVVHTRRDRKDLRERVRMPGGVEVHHVDAGPPGPIAKDELLPHMDEFADALREAWRYDRPDVVHAHFWMSGYAALQAAAGLDIPVVQTFHALGVVKRRYQGPKDTSPPARLEIERDIVKRASGIVATCTDEVFELIRMGSASDKLTVIPCGVDLDLFSPHGPSEPRDSARHRLVCVGRLVERKGIGNVISALSGLPDAELIVVGGPERAQLDRDPEARRLLALARKAGVPDRVEFTGRLDRGAIAPLLRSADVLVTVPWYEPFGITPLEAMACGTPVVASAVGGLIDTVVDRRTGVHVPPRDPERLSVELTELLADAPRLAAYGRAAVKRAGLYDWNRIAASTLDLYARVPRRRRRRQREHAVRRFALPPTPVEHVNALGDALDRLRDQLDTLGQLGERLAGRLLDGGRVLAVGNGGSAAQAQHLTAELVGRYHCDREPLSAICLHADTSSLTAIANDYGLAHAFARQVEAHGRPGDILIALSTSGRSQNVVNAARTARACGIEVWALTGPAPNPLADTADEKIAFACPSAATIQELHLVAVHAICSVVDREVMARGGTRMRQRALT
jgi:phosphoheptose isomerase/glycosyltransferase involved in cell wall biosynthesis